MAKAKNTKDSAACKAHDTIVNALNEATGLSWSPPPEKPSLLQNGYHTETEMMRAPHLVRRLKEVSMEVTGRPRAILFERSGQKHVSINIPREIAENEKFISALSASEHKIADLIIEQAKLNQQAPLARPTKSQRQQMKLPKLPMPANASQHLPGLQRQPSATGC